MADDSGERPLPRTQGGDSVTGVPDVASTIADLAAQAEHIGGSSPLLHADDDPAVAIDITKAHPGSLPQFISGKVTRLSNLFRDEVALGVARRAAEAITAKNVELHTVRSIDAIHLAVGLASWSVEAVEFRAPVLLRPLAIRRNGTDFELKLHGGFRVNPELVEALRSHFGIDIDGAALARMATEDGVFRPQPVIDTLRRCVPKDALSVQPRLLVSSFGGVAGIMSADITRGGSDILDAILGQPDDRPWPTSADEVVPADPDLRPPASDPNLLDADAEQELVLAQIAAGRSLAVRTLPGTGGTQTVINAIGVLLRQHRRVLIVSARRSTVEGVRHRLAEIGLPALAVNPASASRDMIRAITRNEQATAPKSAEIDEALVRLRSLLRDYRTALRSVDEHLGVSPLQAVAALSVLRRRHDPPQGQERLDPETLRRTANHRALIAKRLETLADLGEFRVGPAESPWYGVSFESADEAARAHALAKRLAGEELPRVVEQGRALVTETGMHPFRTVADLADYVRLLIEIRDSLDRFTPQVFERPIEPLVRAYAPRREGTGVGPAERRQLKRVAKEYVRAGVHVPDMYEALQRISRQRTEWKRYVAAGTIPDVPPGLPDLRVSCQRLIASLDELDRIRLTPGQPRLAETPIDQLARLLQRLAADSEVMDNLMERAEIREQLDELGLGSLLRDLAARHVTASRVRDELDFCWWQSALEHLLASDRALLGANTAVVDRLERDFRLVDEAHASAAGKHLAWDRAREWSVSLVDAEEESIALKLMLQHGGATPGELWQDAPRLFDALAPVWIASPYEVPLLPDRPFDCVIIADAGAINLAEAAPALRRSRQVVVFGDPATQRPSPFEIACARPIDPAQPTPEAMSVDGEEASAGVAFDWQSVYARLAQRLPEYRLTRSYRAGGEDLAALVNDAFYDGEIQSWPWAGSFLGRGSLVVDYVEGGTGTPDPVTGAVESPDAERDRVVTLVTEHVLHRPRESLMVITASAKHAERVRQALNAVFASRTDLAEFATRDSAEPFAVLTLEQSVAESRDRVIFSLGYGKTRHGRSLSDFGELSTPDGQRLLTVGMTRARRSMVIVSSARPEDFEEGRLEHGAQSLMQVLARVALREQESPEPRHADPLRSALAEQLRLHGVEVELDYRGLLPMVARFGDRAAAIDGDEPDAGESLREELRLRPLLLRRLGWHYVRVHAFDLYTDPADVARRIAVLLGAVEDEASQPEATTEEVQLSGGFHGDTA